MVRAMKEGVTLDPTRTFTASALILLLATPLTQTIQSIPTLAGAISCVGRIQAFLDSPTRVDRRRTPGNQHFGGPGTGSISGSSSSPNNSTDSSLLKNSSEKSYSVGLLKDSDAIKIKNGVFGWTTEGPPILKDINLCIPRSQLSIVVGPIACGKSTLLKAMLGETLVSEGLVDVASSSVSYCDQTAWLSNATIEKNIIGFSRFNAEWYQVVLHACVLDKDLGTLPHGDQTLIGSNGITLSGGQKMRLVSSSFI
jgi:ATP-binding cassette, subfamily C (CFTR/MRP), member 1